MKIVLAICVLLCHQAIYSQEISAMKIGELETFINSGKQPMVVNFWATWCGPCVEEMPWFNRILNAKNNKDVSLVFVSLDSKAAFPDKIKSFLNRRNIKATFVWLDETNADVFCPRINSDWAGTIPATLFVNNTSGYRKFLEQQISSSQLRKETQLLKR
jgi:thiol-disulfide isomerase/thioredoxin